MPYDKCSRSTPPRRVALMPTGSAMLCRKNTRRPPCMPGRSKASGAARRAQAVDPAAKPVGLSPGTRSSMDRASVFGTEGCRFESCRVYCRALGFREFRRRTMWQIRRRVRKPQKSSNRERLGGSCRGAERPVRDGGRRPTCSRDVACVQPRALRRRRPRRGGGPGRISRVGNASGRHAEITPPGDPAW